MPLTDAMLRALKPAQKATKRYDSRGLYLVIEPTGSKLWRLKYMYEGREKLISLGRYPEITLADARRRRDEARKKVAHNIDPAAERAAAKIAQVHTVKAVATEWLGNQAKLLEPDTLTAMRRRFEEWVYPKIGNRPIAVLKAADLLPVLKRIEAANRTDTAHRTSSQLSRVWRYAIATGRAERDITVDTKGALTPLKAVHHAAITDPTEFGRLLRAIDGYTGAPTTLLALKIAPYVFVRPGELRAAEWAEFILTGPEPEWRIPAHKTKMRRQHLVPLARQVVDLLEELKMHSGEGRYLFPTYRDMDRPISDNTMNAALRRLDFAKDEMSSHGFRTTASTMLNELGISPDIIERQLAHAEANATRDAYNRAARIAERRTMMQRWADHLDKLRATKSDRD